MSVESQDVGEVIDEQNFAGSDIYIFLFQKDVSCKISPLKTKVKMNFVAINLHFLLVRTLGFICF